MKKTLFCFLILTITGICCVTTAIAKPQITHIHGGYGISATVTNATGTHWVISLWGSQIFMGMSTDGIVANNKTTIRTPLFPPAVGVGRITITITLYRIILPVAIEQRSALMLGPIVVFVH